MVQINLKEIQASSQPASDIFVVNGCDGSQPGVERLIALMGKQGTKFYKSQTADEKRGRWGIFAADDIVIFKVNSQWDERGGTNTDLLKSLIKVISQHPDGFTGEIVVADNGQAQYGPTGKGGSFDYARNNAEDISQSVKKVVDSITECKVSTYQWDNITTTAAKEYSEDDMIDGYVVSNSVNPQTSIRVSYPKFTTKFGTHISLKWGIWDAVNRRYDNDHLKMINVPVLKSHFIYGVTSCIKHYMGVVSDKLTANLGGRAHVSVGKGGMGSQMVGSRFPALNIMDAIWINARPNGGPGTKYEAATRVNVVAAGKDPVALDFWAAKNILMPVARENGHTDLSPIDMDNTGTDKCAGQWMRLAAEELRRAGYLTNLEESHMNVFISN